MVELGLINAGASLASRWQAFPDVAVTNDFDETDNTVVFWGLPHTGVDQYFPFRVNVNPPFKFPYGVAVDPP